MLVSSPDFSASDQAIYLIGEVVIQSLRIPPQPNLTHKCRIICSQRPGYANGNAEPGMDSATLQSQSVMSKTLVRFEKLVVAFRKKPDDGKIKYIVFILDHDGFVQSHIVSCILVLTVCLIMQLLSSNYPQWWPL